MSEVLFYHLERQSLHEVLPVLLERTLSRGWRAVVQVRDEGLRDDLSRHLWTFRDDAFLPHGTPEDGHSARQPIWLTCGDETPNGATVRFCADRAQPADPAAFERVVILFSADDPDAVSEARALWKPLKAAGHTCTYWQQKPGGGWEKKG